MPHLHLRLVLAVLLAVAAAACADDPAVDGQAPGAGASSRTTDWPAVRDWTAQKRDEYLVLARTQHEQLRAEGDVLRKRLSQAAEAQRPKVEAALADFERARESYRAELYRMSSELRDSASDAFTAARSNSSKLRAEAYEAYERARMALEQALASDAGSADAPAGG